jgi:hypothetical protein
MITKLASHMVRAGSTPVFLAALFIGCGGGEPAPAVPPPAPSAAPAPPPPEPTASASAAAEAPAPSASASAAPAKPQSSGRPAVLKSDPTSVTDSFGSSPGAKIEIGEGKEVATLRIQENTLGQLTNVTFKLDAKGKSNGAPGGKIYHLTPVLPPDGKPVTVPSNNGTPFEFSLPGGGKRGANLAIGSIETDASGREKIKWQVIAPKRVDEGTGVAYFELTDLKDAYLHVTSKAPADEKKDEKK